jgi:hypothetical protein
MLLNIYLMLLIFVFFHTCKPHCDIFFDLPTAGSSASGWAVFFLNSIEEVLLSGKAVIFPLPST